MVAVELQPVMIYLGLAIVGIFSGFGNSMGQYFFNEWWKPHVMERFKKGVKEGLRNDEERLKKLFAKVEEFK